jgi:hypothetical protein
MENANMTTLAFKYKSICLGTILAVSLLSCNQQPVSIRTQPSQASGTGTSDLNLSNSLVLSWDSPKDSNIKTYTVYAGASSSDSQKKIHSSELDQEKDFDKENPTVTISLDEMKEYSGAGEVCFTVTSSNEEGESEKSAKVCESF